MAQRVSQILWGVQSLGKLSGVPAHPDAPAGGGGVGAFQKGGAQSGTRGNDSDPIPHPESPAGSYAS